MFEYKLVMLLSIFVAFCILLCYFKIKLAKMKERPILPLTLIKSPPARAFLLGECYQSVCLPEPIIYYIAKNPSTANVYKKLIRTCKYFYNINPILVVSDLYFRHVQCYGQDKPVRYEWKVCLKESKGTVQDARVRFEGAEKIDLDMIPFKYWITDCVSIYILESIDSYMAINSGMYENVATSIIPKIYRCDATHVTLYAQVITFENFLLLASNASSIDIQNTVITENDGKTRVMLETVIEKLPKIREIDWYCWSACKYLSSSTVKELLKIPHFFSITKLRMGGIPEGFDIKALIDLIKEHKNIEVRCNFFMYKYSDRFQQEVDEIRGEIEDTKVFTYKRPSFGYLDHYD